MILLLKGLQRVGSHIKKNGTVVRQYSRIVRDADKFAERAHAGQFRSALPGASPAPYITHPRAVASVLREAGIHDSKTIAAALLHDTIEDTGTTRDRLAALFGDDVADTVVEVTNSPFSTRDEKAAMQVEKARRMSARASAVKMADKIANLRDIVRNPPNWDAARKRRYFDDAKSMIDAMREPHPVLRCIFDTVYSNGVD